MLKYFEIENTVIAELTDKKFIISQPQDILDLIGDSVSYNCSRLIDQGAESSCRFLQASYPD